MDHNRDITRERSTPKIVSIGTALPPYRATQESHYQVLIKANGIDRREALQLRKIYARSGITYRHSVLEEFIYGDREENIVFHPNKTSDSASVSKRMQQFELFAGDLCENAVTECLKNLPSFEVSRITHLITFSCTGMYAPGIDIDLVRKLGLNRNVERTCINFMGCYAGINALKVAYHIIRSQPDAVVLLAGVELCTLHYQKSDTQDQLIANALFSDGAAACIVANGSFDNQNAKGTLAIQNFYSEFEPSGIEDMVWRIGDFGFDLRLSVYIPELIKKSIHSLVQKLFNKANIAQGDISFYAIHPGGMSVLEACESALNITKQQNEISYDVLSNYGNMSSVTIFFVLKRYMDSFKEEDKGKKLLACAFGPGLTMESMIAEFC